MALPRYSEHLARKIAQRHYQWLSEQCHAKTHKKGMRKVSLKMVDTLSEAGDIHLHRKWLEGTEVVVGRPQGCC